MLTIIALDQSTSATKAILYEVSGNLLDKTSLEHRQLYPQPGWVEHDAEEIWRNTLAALRSLIERNRARIADAICLSITNQRETVVVFDRATSKPLHNAIVWQCRRGSAICAEMVGHDELVNRKTGLKIDTYFSASKLTWLIRNKPDVAEKLAKGKAVASTIDGYLIHRLTGGRVTATDATNASRTLLFDITRMKWDEELCRLFEVPIGALPEVRDSTAQFGTTDLDGLLNRSIPICGVMGDSQASLFAHRGFLSGMAKVTLGTGSSILLNLGEQLRYGGDAAVSTVAWSHQGKATYCFEGIISYAAATVAWLKDQLGLIQNAAETEVAAMAVSDNGGVYLVPAFAGLSAPYWSPNAKAAIVGLTAHANRNHIIRAALESIAYQLRDVLAAMRDRAGVKLTTIQADGGATRNRFLMQFIADMASMEIAAADVAECSPLGAALAGALGMGVYKSFDEIAALPREATIYRSQMPRAVADELHAGWLRAVKQVLAGVKA